MLDIYVHLNKIKFYFIQLFLWTMSKVCSTDEKLNCRKLLWLNCWLNNLIVTFFFQDDDQCLELSIFIATMLHHLIAMHSCCINQNMEISMILFLTFDLRYSQISQIFEASLMWDTLTTSLETPSWILNILNAAS